MGTRLETLHDSVTRLRTLAGGLDEQQIVRQAYPSEWTVADVLSHIGSGAVIMEQGVSDALLGRTTAGDFAPSVWDVWNAKAPRQQVDDALVNDQSLLDRLESLSEADRSEVHLPVGPMSLDFEQAVGMRLNEHVVHTWDVAVTFDAAATLPPEAVDQIVDNLGLIARFTGRPFAGERLVAVRTTGPTRGFTITLGTDGVAFEAAEVDRRPDLELPAEALIRLVYGRLDPDHTPAFIGDAETLDLLRQTFPGP